MVNWRVERFKNKPKGMVCDVHDNLVTIVFSFVEREDGMDTKGRELGFDDIVNLFKRFEPRLKLTN